MRLEEPLQIIPDGESKRRAERALAIAKALAQREALRAEIERLGAHLTPADAALAGAIGQYLGIREGYRDPQLLPWLQKNGLPLIPIPGTPTITSTLQPLIAAFASTKVDWGTLARTSLAGTVPLLQAQLACLARAPRISGTEAAALSAVFHAKEAVHLTSVEALSEFALAQRSISPDTQRYYEFRGLMFAIMALVSALWSKGSVYVGQAAYSFVRAMMASSKVNQHVSELIDSSLAGAESAMEEWRREVERSAAVERAMESLVDGPIVDDPSERTRRLRSLWDPTGGET